MFRYRSGLIPLTAALLSALIAPARAQDYERVAPKLPAKTEAPAVLPPAPEKVVSADRTPVGVILKALVFVPGAEQITSSVAASGVNTEQIPELSSPRFAEQLTPLLEHALTIGDLDRIKSLTTNWMRAHQRPFVAVTIPPQNVSNGVVHVVVSQYRVGKIRVEGGRHFSSSFIRHTSGLESGQALRLDYLQTDLDRLNHNPFLNVDAVFEPGDRPAETDVTLKAHDRLPLRGYAGYDNLGTRSLGVAEFNAGMNWGNAFGTGQVLSYQFTRSLTGGYSSHSISDAVPLPWGDQLLIFGSFGNERPELASIFKDEGHSGQASARYIRFLPRFRSLTQDVQLGYDFKTTDNNLEFAGFHVFGVQAEVDQFPLIYDATLNDRYGQTAVQDMLVYSPGRVTPNNTTLDLATLVPGAKAHYFYNRFLVTRTTRLPKAFSAVSRVTLQQTTANLPYSEQIGGGGVGSVRGYYTDTAFGSKGEMFSQELRLPPFALSRLVDRNSEHSDRAQFGVFFDYANLKQATPIPDVKSPVQLASTGILARYSLSRYFDFQFDTGWRLLSAPTVPRRGVYSQIALTAGF